MTDHFRFCQRIPLGAGKALAGNPSRQRRATTLAEALAALAVVAVLAVVLSQFAALVHQQRLARRAHLEALQLAESILDYARAVPFEHASQAALQQWVQQQQQRQPAWASWEVQLAVHEDPSGPVPGRMITVTVQPGKTRNIPGRPVRLALVKFQQADEP